jgi:hypothetical protein
VIVILVSLTLDGSKGMEKVRVIVLLTATPVAVSAGSEDDISNAGTLEANLYDRSIPIAAAVEAVILSYVILH